jgi:hypothetical protein
MSQQEEKAKPICFVIAPIDDLGTEVRRRSDQMRDHIFDPVAGQICGYRVIRADALSEPGLITSQVIQHLIDDPLVIADLTGRNPNVFYELAIRHAVRKPVVQIIHLGERIPFDVAQSRTIEVDYHDLDSVAKCKSELEKQIHAVEKDPSLTDNPISFAIDLQASRRSANPVEKTNAEIIELLSTLSMQMRDLASNVRDQEMMLTSPRFQEVVTNPHLGSLGSYKIIGVDPDLITVHEWKKSDHPGGVRKVDLTIKNKRKDDQDGTK